MADGLERTLGGGLRAEHAGRTVLLQGWVDRRRDHGGVLFVDLRDRTGIAQVVFNPETEAEAHATADTFRLEYVVEIEGEVRARPGEAVNADMPTGEVEVAASAARVLSKSKTPPFPINEETTVDERIRMRYRYLDLRRDRMHRNMRIRHLVNKTIRDYLDGEDFREVETPILYKTTPEGARDYLVPSRMQPGSFYALPQSPQTLKQLLMIAGFERYYQLARCFRDEDLRADRQPEFTQLDLEMSFVTADDVLALMEPLFVRLWRLIGVDLPTPFERLPYSEAIARYGSDKPDRRIGMEIADLTDVFRDSGFKVFSGTIAGGGVVRGLAVPGGASRARREIDDWVDHARGLGARGLAWLPVTAEPVGPVANNTSPEERLAAAEQTGAREGDIIIFAAGEERSAADLLGMMRLEIARRTGVKPDREWDMFWVTDFPMFEWNATEERPDPVHHAFTRPLDDDLPLLETDPLKVRASAYDTVCNGLELGGGSLRIYDQDVQSRIFRAIGLDDQTARLRFGFFLEALQYGTPPHAGIAYGIDRIARLLCREDDIRQVIAFPKTQQGQDLMAGTPSPADPQQLAELGLALRAQPKQVGDPDPG
jgi:aspartyl-tRNA synthetase